MERNNDYKVSDGVRGSQEEKGKSIEQRSHGKEQWNGDPAAPKPGTQHKKEQIGREGRGYE